MINVTTGIRAEEVRLQGQHVLFVEDREVAGRVSSVFVSSAFACAHPPVMLRAVAASRK